MDGAPVGDFGSATPVIGSVPDPADPSRPLILTGIAVSPAAIYVTGRQATGPAPAPDSYLLVYPPGGGTGTVLADCQRDAPLECTGAVSMAGVAIQGSSLYTGVALTFQGAGSLYRLPIGGGTLTLAFPSTYMNYGPQHCNGNACGVAANASRVCWRNSAGIDCLPQASGGSEIQLFVPPAGDAVLGLAMDDASFFTWAGQSGSSWTLVGTPMTSGASWTVATGIPGESIAVDGTDAYWATQDGCNVFRAPRTGGGTTTPLWNRCAGITAITVDDTSVWFTTQAGAVERMPK